MGTQEGLFAQLKDIDRAFPAYDRISLGRDGEASATLAQLKQALETSS